MCSDLTRLQSILVVDDDKDILELMEISLKRRGFAVRSLYDCTRVFDELETQSPDLVILDINLGPCQGTDICAAIKANPAFNHIPVILYSAGMYQNDIITHCNGDAFIHKPFSYDSLVNLIGKLC